MAQRTTQLRSIEKRLLTRFKDKTPVPLTNLDTLMEGTYRHVLETTELIEECQMELARSSNNLSCITSILIFLMHLTASMTYEEISLVQSALSPIVNTTQEQVNNSDKLENLLTLSLIQYFHLYSLKIHYLFHYRDGKIPLMLH